MRVHQYPDLNPSNPYTGLLFDSLRDQGCTVSAFNGRGRAVLANAVKASADILHIHWVSVIVTQHGPARTVLELLMFHAGLAIWRLRGGKIVWTVHNLQNHERERIRLERLHSRIVARMADRILVHGETVRPIAAEALKIPEDRISVVHHGNYSAILAAAPPDTAHEGRRFLYFGQIRAYKGVPDLIAAFRRLDGPHRLLVAGRVKGDGLLDEITSAAGGDPRITLKLDFISDEELEQALAWSDVVALPYRDIFTSGSLLLALTAGRPVIAPDRGLIPEYVVPRDAYLYDPAASDGLHGALQEAARDPGHAGKAAASAERAGRFGWDRIASELVAIYTAVCPRAAISERESPNA